MLQENKHFYAFSEDKLWESVAVPSSTTSTNIDSKILFHLVQV